MCKVAETKEEYLYPRSCDNCGKGMDSGYIIGGNTYCDRNDSECRKTIFSDKEWDEHYDDEGEDCWTTWFELEDDFNYTKSGALVEMAKCCSEISKNEFEQELEWIDGSPTESETWKCKVCDKEWEVPCYIQREWDDVESRS